MVDPQTVASVEASRGWGRLNRSQTELIFTIILALAAVGTAWAAFQSAKWSGLQAISFAEAAAARTESAKKADEADNLRALDVISFAEWLAAVNQETGADPAAYTSVWAPEEGTASAFYYERFRDEFRSAFDAWLALRPLSNPDAPSTPFVMPEYQLASQAEAAVLVAVAEQRALDALENNQRSDNYVLLGVLFAMVLFFVALGGKTEGSKSRIVLLVLSVVTLLGCLAVMATFPVRI